MAQVVHDNTTSYSLSPNFPDAEDLHQFNHEVAVGQGRYLKIGIFYQAGSDLITHVKYAGELLQSALDNPIDVQNKKLDYYYLVAPTEGINQVEVQFSQGIVQTHIIASSYLLVDQFIPHGTIVTSTAGGGAGAIDSIITLEDGGLGVDHVGVDSTTSVTADAGQTSRATVGTAPGEGYGGDQTGSGASDEGGGPGDITMGWTFSSDDGSGHVAVPLRPQTAARERIYEYHENAFMSREAGAPRVTDAQGRQVMPEQIRANNWLRSEGPHMITTHVYDDAAEDPALVFGENVGISGREIVFVPSKESEAARILGGLTRL